MCIRDRTQYNPGLDADMVPVADRGEESYTGSGKLTGRKALITGGDSGIGAAVAIAYAREGADVAIAYLPEEEEDAKVIVGLIEDAGRTAVAIPGNLETRQACFDTVDAAVKGLGGIDILVNNAGRQIAHDHFLDISEEEWDLTMKTNIYAPFYLAQAAVPHMEPGSSIIFSSSIQAYDPSDTLVHYAVTKAAMNNMSKGMSMALLADKGIRVNAVAPGPIWTPLQPSHGQPM